MTSSNGKMFRVTGHLCGEFPVKMPVTRNLDVFFDLRLNKWLSNQSWGMWCETLSRPLWRHNNVSQSPLIPHPDSKVVLVILVVVYPLELVSSVLDKLDGLSHRNYDSFNESLTLGFSLGDRLAFISYDRQMGKANMATLLTHISYSRDIFLDTNQHESYSPKTVAISPTGPWTTSKLFMVEDKSVSCEHICYNSLRPSGAYMRR